MNKKLLCIATCTALFAHASAAASETPATLKRLEAKWGNVMTKIRGWNEESLRQFREGYKDYPAAVLEKALAARSFEKMMATLDEHAAERSQGSMQKAMKVYSMAETLPEDANDAQVAEARALVAKSLGDDARDLVFIPITPCTVWDTRFATDPASAGMINNATTKRFYTHLDGAGGSYAAWGGNPTCPETAQNFIGVRPFAVMMTVYINDASAQGWLTLYRDGDADPSFATISVYYAPGPTRTQTVISKSSRGYGTGIYDIAATSRFGNVNASASITGYFVKVDDPGAFTGNITLVDSTPTAGNVFKGANRFIHNAGDESTFVGVNAGNFTHTGWSNTGMGIGALTSNTTGFENTAVGRGALLSTTTGIGNTAVGANALALNAGANNNTALGTSTLTSNTSGSDNTALGAYTLNANTGNDNTAVGSTALNTNTSGSSNIAVGFLALMNNTTGSHNVAIGREALANNANGTFNIAIGSSAGANSTGSGNIYIENFGEGLDNSTLRIGTSLSRSFIAGIRGVSTGVADAVPVVIDSNGQLGTVSSSAAVKENVSDMGAASSALMQLRPVTFDYRTPQSSGRLQYGLIAEEVDQVYPGLVAKRADGSAETVMYQFLPPMLLNEYQKQQREIAALREQLARMQGQLDQMKGTSK